MDKKRVLVTGASGYLGTLLMSRLVQETGVEFVVATDVKPLLLKADVERFCFLKLDVRSPQLAEAMREYRIDTVVHLATIVTPGRKSNRELEYSVDVLGTKNVLESCLKSDVRHLIVTSSGAAYGYHPDNPEWIDETWPLRGNEEFAYSHHKRLVEEMLEDYRKRYPQLKQLILRPGTILGESTNNQITALFHKRFIMGIRGADSPFVFIWDQDVVECICLGILEERTGVFNLAGDGTVTMREIAHILNKPYLSLPAGLVKTVLWILKKLRLTQYGPEQVNFLRYRPVLSNHRLKEEFGFQPRKNSLEVFKYYLDSQSK